MTLIEGIGDEVVQCFVALIFVLIVVLAWCTTSITNEGSLRTVFLLERRRLRAARRLTNHTESATIAEGTAVEELEPNQSTSTMDEDKPPDSSNSNDQEESHPNGEETRIVEAMDAPRDSECSSDLRKRRLAFYTKKDNQSGNSSSSNSDNMSSQIGDNLVTCIDHACKSSETICANKCKAENVPEDSDKICVKLMYLNDVIRHVDGGLQEKLGDFKRRHFQMELESNKLVKLIFNGHVLQQDTETLEKCGLFDNCVVHCLVHQRPPSSSSGLNSSSRESSTTSLGSNYYTSNNNNNQPHEWHLENYLFGILCCFLGAAWYLRYVYSHLYTVTATIGLILMTGIFTIIMFGMHFPDNVELNQQRAENSRSHQ